MADLTVKRTLVKSPPELWTELSEVESLARHLGEFGDIRITKLEPETTVAWEGEHASGTVEIEASGWGTKVTLTAAVAEVEEAPQAPATPGPDRSTSSDEAAGSEPEPEAATPVAIGSAGPSLGGESVSPAAVPRPPVAARPAQARPPRRQPAWRSFLARLLGPRPAAQAPRPGWQPSPVTAAPEGRPAASTQQPDSTPQAAAEPPSSPVAHAAGAPPEAAVQSPPRALAAKPEVASPAVDGEQALAVLEGTLDNLGSAHHRPFSRE